MFILNIFSKILILNKPCELNELTKSIFNFQASKRRKRKEREKREERKSNRGTSRNRDSTCGGVSTITRGYLNAV